MNEGRKREGRGRKEEREGGREREEGREEGRGREGKRGKGREREREGGRERGSVSGKKRLEKCTESTDLQFVGTDSIFSYTLPTVQLRISVQRNQVSYIPSNETMRPPQVYYQWDLLFLC